MNRIFRCLSSYVLRNGFGERGNYARSPKVKNGWLIGILSPLRPIYSELEDAVTMRIQALFMKEKPSWNLVMHSILQVVDALYASLQIRCTAHNLRIAGFTIYKIIYQKARLFLSMCIAVYIE